VKIARIFLIIALFVVTACGAPAAPADSGSSGESSPAADAWPNFIDPAVGNDFSSSTSLANLYDSLVFPNADGTVSPWLATEWEAAEDGLSWTISLRDDVTFHDGSAMTASDVVYSLNRLQTIGEGYAYMLENVESAEAVDDTTIQFNLSEPSGLFISSLVRLYVVSEAMVTANTAADGPYGENGDYGKDWLLTNDAGTGPYTAVDFKLEEYLQMEKYADWWGEFAENAPAEARFIATTETATVRTLMSDQELEISDQWQTVEALNALQGLDGIEVAAIPTFSTFYYMINTAIAPTDDINCRRAIAYAFDYEQAVALEWPGTQQTQGLASTALGGHDADSFTFTRDLDAAAEALAECEYADEIDDYPVQIHWISEVPDEEKFALLFQANMTEAGIPVEIVSTPWLSVVENASSQETSPHIVTIYVSSDLPEIGPMIKQRYHSSTAPTWSQNEWLMDEDLDSRIDEALTTLDQEERFQKYAELQQDITERVPSLFLYDQVQKQAYQSYVDWPASRGESSALSGYQIYAAQIGINQ